MSFLFNTVLGKVQVFCFLIVYFWLLPPGRSLVAASGASCLLVHKLLAAEHGLQAVRASVVAAGRL